MLKGAESVRLSFSACRSLIHTKEGPDPCSRPKAQLVPLYVVQVAAGASMVPT